MLSFVEIATILVSHWIFDFIVQTDEQAKGKSLDVNYLNEHVFTYSLCMFIPMGLLFYNGPFNMIGSLLLTFVFCLWTFGFHWITDYYTSRKMRKLYEQEKRHEFFVYLGFDQLLHSLQLFATYIVLKSI